MRLTFKEISRKDKDYKSLKELYKIGRGPSSSHTMGPERAVLKIKEKYKEADSIRQFFMAHLL